ncbi:MAG: DNA-processing protein DprA [Leptospirales bacterium]|jgi:DNA protecting protein DprA
MRRGLTFQEAVFVAALPYRKSVYQSGGFAQSPGPGGVIVLTAEAAGASDLFSEPASVAWEEFLRRHFTKRDLIRAAGEAASYAGDELAGPNASWYSRELEDRTGGGRVGFVSVWDADYPVRLRNCYDAPPVLFYCGAEAPRESRPGSRRLRYAEPRPERAVLREAVGMVGIVGTRQAHPFAGEAVRAYVRDLARDCTDRAGPVIVSGLALGIDRIAHEAALECGLPGIAVLGAGLLHAGPRANLDLPRRAREANASFVLLSEFPPHTPARAAHFPRRNRVIGGLVEAVAVLQAPLKSGAMITARFALDEGRDVLAFDHDVLRAASGSNDGARALLEAGATPIVLPELEARLVKEPPFGAAGRRARLALWKRASLGQGLRWLGGRYYLEAG